MIHDAGDGTTGRRVWQFTGPPLPRDYFVMAATEQAAREWLSGVLPGVDTTGVQILDRGSNDRTEVALWRDEALLTQPTDPANPEGSA